MFTKKLKTAGMVLTISAGLILVLIDQYAKLYVLKKGGFFIFQDFLDVNFYENYGTAFGIPVPLNILYPLVALSLAFLIWRYIDKIRDKYYWALAAMALVFGGAISNIIDRILHGFVIDYIHFSFGSTFKASLTHLAEISLASSFPISS